RCAMIRAPIPVAFAEEHYWEASEVIVNSLHSGGFHLDYRPIPTVAEPCTVPATHTGDIARGDVNDDCQGLFTREIALLEAIKCGLRSSQPPKDQCRPLAIDSAELVQDDFVRSTVHREAMRMVGLAGIKKLSQYRSGVCGRLSM